MFRRSLKDSAMVRVLSREPLSTRTASNRSRAKSSFVSDSRQRPIILSSFSAGIMIEMLTVVERTDCASTGTGIVCSSELMLSSHQCLKGLHVARVWRQALVFPEFLRTAGDISEPSLQRYSSG